MNEVKVGRFFTSARKFKQLIGTMPDGTSIWGGPYTVTQCLVALVVAAFGFVLRALGLWGGNFLVDTFVIAVFACAAGFGVGKLPAARRSLVHMFTSCLDLFFVDAGGYWRGKPLPSHLVPAKTKARPETTVKPTELVDQFAGALEDALREDLAQPETASAGNGGLARIRAVTTSTAA